MTSNNASGLDTFAKLLEENCNGLDADSVFLLTQRVRSELAAIQREVNDSRQKLRQALLRDRLLQRAAEQRSSTQEKDEARPPELSLSVLENIGMYLQNKNNQT